MSETTPDLRERLLFRAATWDGERYGDQGLRLRAEDTVKLLREAAAALAVPRERLCTCEIDRYDFDCPLHSGKKDEVSTRGDS